MQHLRLKQRKWTEIARISTKVILKEIILIGNMLCLECGATRNSTMKGALPFRSQLNATQPAELIAEISAVDLHYLMKSLGLRITSSAEMGLIPSFSISLRSALLSISNGDLPSSESLRTELMWLIMRFTSS